MGSPNILIPQLVLASLAIDAVVLYSIPAQADWPSLWAAVLSGLAGGQVNLATLWATLGRRRLPWRLAALAVVLAGWSAAFHAGSPIRVYPSTALWFFHFLVQMAMLSVILLAARLFGARLTHEKEPLDANRDDRRQFTLRHLFGWLTATAIALSALRATFAAAAFGVAAFQWTGILLFGSLISLLGMIAFCTVLDARSATRRLESVLVAALIVLAIESFAVSFQVLGGRFLVASLVYQGSAMLYCFLAAIILREAGIRVIWPPTEVTKGHKR